MTLRREIDLPDILPLHRTVAPRRIRDQKLVLDLNWKGDPPLLHVEARQVAICWRESDLMVVR